jgi:hypothetical protein
MAFHLWLMYAVDFPLVIFLLINRLSQSPKEFLDGAKLSADFRKLDF